jgi:hypothetical protein
MSTVANPGIMRAVEKLGYRVTIGDVAAQAGLDVKVAERDLLALASDVGAHLQVSEAGEIAYLFPRNFRDILRGKFWRLRWQENLSKVWNFIFYLIRISFGIYLFASIAIIGIAIVVILIALNSRDDNGGSDWGGSVDTGSWGMGNWFVFFWPDYYGPSTYRSSGSRQSSKHSRREADRPLNFLEAIYSFLFGDGNPNADLEDRRWQAIGTVIRNQGGAVVAEQIAPYLDDVGRLAQQEYEDYMLPVMSRFNGRPEVSPEGQLVYHFPELQVTAKQSKPQAVGAYLKEKNWKFTQASSGQVMAAIGLGALNLIGALVLGGLLRDIGVGDLGSFINFVAAIYWVLLGYGTGFLGVPLLRYFWIQGRNRKVEARNDQRQMRAMAFNQADETIQHKLGFARQFATETVVREDDLAYTTEEDLTEQEARQVDKIDAEWQRRLEDR